MYTTSSYEVQRCRECKERLKPYNMAVVTIPADGTYSFRFYDCFYMNENKIARCCCNGLDCARTVIENVTRR